MNPTRAALLAAVTAAAALPAAAPTTAAVASMRPAAHRTYVSTPMTAKPLLLPPPVAPVDKAPTETMPAPRTYSPVPAPQAALFRTPEAAMRFLARAYNAHDDAALRKVTTPEARTALDAMRAEAPDLLLRWCTFREYQGDYECTFSHGFAASAHRTGRGRATFTVAPATKPGWYMTVLESCG
jgi:hypothetical protein